MAKPLTGIRVLDLGRFIACPFCGMLLADLGAEVIRVERSIGGDDRYYELLTPSGDTYHFTNINRNKKGISLNFERNPRAREILDELVRHSDVLIENFSSGAAKAIGITYDELKKVKPDIIFAHVSGFGSTGPYANRIGFDMIAKAMAGAMAISGFPGIPVREQVPWVDFGTGSLTAIGILAALLERKDTGKGKEIGTSLLQTAVSYMAPVISEWETGKADRQQIGNRRYWTGPCDLYQAKDGKWVYIALLGNSIWRRFAKFIGGDELANNPKFHTDPARFEHRDILDNIVKDWVATHSAEEIMTLAEKIPVPAGICLDHTEVASHPQVKEQNMLTEVLTPDGKSRIVVGNIPFKMSSDEPLKVERSFPAIGQHNEEIYTDLLGYNQTDLDRFKEEGVL
ncbi:CaiB/BaiF CoA transferase family protein [Chloroflexota bacterium]